MVGVPVPNAPFTLKDDGYVDGDFDSIDGRVAIGPNGVEMFFKGFGTACMDPGQGSPIFVEVYEGKLILRVWADINSEDPTHVIQLDGSKESARSPE